MSSVLVVAAHPDDEVFGCGGTVARLVADGMTIRVITFTDGVGARKPDEDESAIRRRTEHCAAMAVLGAKLTTPQMYPDNALDTVPLLHLVQVVEEKLREFRPSTVYTHHPGDLNIDHQFIARAVVTATRPYPGQVVRRVYGFEVPGSTEWAVPGAVPFVPTRFVPLTEAQMHAKSEALRCFASEVRDVPHPRSWPLVEALAMVRGSQVGYPYAEAFTVIREIA